MEKAFIFDMDGVIINSEPLHNQVELEFACQNNIPLTEKDMEKYVGMPADAVWALIIKENNLELDLPDIIREMEEQKIICFKESDLQPIKGIPDLLQELKSLDYRIALASSSPKVLIQTVLDKFQLASLFDCIVSAEEVKRGKPAPDIYLEAAARLKVPASSCLVLEDSKAGIEAANKAGMKTIGYQNPDSGNQDLAKARHIVHGIEEVKYYL
ncbi:HAD family hydrolase [Bacillus tuaregi]|uniref:HAD family hydrolase n=1 Tax=Bacillus tuaregi TaxID=1816695 RepID=UPI0008F89265|nr:HAD family phosphatase [Bacillus tuaregi]